MKYATAVTMDKLRATKQRQILFENKIQGIQHQDGGGSGMWTEQETGFQNADNLCFLTWGLVCMGPFGFQRFTEFCIYECAFPVCVSYFHKTLKKGGGGCLAGSAG